MAKQYRQIIGDVYNKPWAIMPGKLEAICGVIEARVEGRAAAMTDAEIDRMAADNAPPEHQAGQSIAVLPLWGTLHQHGSMMSRYSGGTSTVQFAKVFREAINDPEIGTVVIHANGPGGTVFGCQECSDLIYNSRSTKKIITAVDPRAASATYWIASSASEMYVTPSGEVGSIGVYMMHRDVSKAEEMEGVKTSLIAIPSGKVLGNPYEPLPDEFRAKIMEENKVYYSAFVEGVARNRGKTVGTVKETFGGGGMVLAEKAAALGMVDGVKTFDQVIDDIKKGAGVSTSSRRTSASRRRELQLAQAENQA